MEKIIELLKKLKSLAEKGVGGEKDNAEQMLVNLMKKHGVTMDMLEDEVRHSREFRINEFQKKIFFQVAGSVLGGQASYWHDKKSKAKVKSYVFKLTELEFLEIKIKFEFYWKAYEEELDVFTSAFIHKNRIYSKKDKDDDQPQKELTLEEKQKILRMRQMMDGMESRSFNKQIGY